MKKILSILLLIVLTFSLVACEDKTENDELVKIAERAIEVTDEFLNAEITDDEAKEKLEVLGDRAWAIYEEYIDSGASVLEKHCSFSDTLHWSISDIESELVDEVRKELNNSLRISNIIESEEKIEQELENYKNASDEED